MNCAVGVILRDQNLFFVNNFADISNWMLRNVSYEIETTSMNSIIYKKSINFEFFWVGGYVECMDKKEVLVSQDFLDRT